MSVHALSLWGIKLSDGIDWELDLPFALCDIIFLLCLACFFKPHPIPLNFVVYWGLAGTLQALITPDITEAFPSLEFVLFFIGHSVIVFAVFFLLARYRTKNMTGLRGLGLASLGILLYTLIMGGVNKIAGFNYGYLSEKPVGASVLDHFGPWPYYVFAGLAIAFVLFLILSQVLKLLPLGKEAIDES